MNQIVPIPKSDVRVRVATTDDLAFIDGLQKKQSKSLGFLQLKALEGKIAQEQVLIAEITDDKVTRCGGDTVNDQLITPSPFHPVTPSSSRVGYLIGTDRYFKRDDVGIIYQMNVAQEHRRSFVAAALLKAQFDRSAYGCRLYCCWCAQDLEANHFWEAMGFVPLAFRAGSEKKARVHIFWEKKIRGNDDTCHWWFPHKTDQGAMRADRLAFPIPPGVHWSEVKPVEIPREEAPTLALPRSSGRGNQKKTREKASLKRPPLCGGLSFAPILPVESTIEKPKREKKPPLDGARGRPFDRAQGRKQKIDAKYVSAAREFRDRYLEQVNEKGFRLESAGKYELTRASASSIGPAIAQSAAPLRLAA